ncbi:helix-turn-helix domain-containing protein [Pseudomonas fitomaticsae]|uniref:Helix-turn-helix domain-containing protein n=1 Tax=Pseudomonas fitomaticsae TaxID=2837969 RepID=A0ABY3Q108_9PSED|nr:helix-turn-helix domain-containing protein [Pseudomonas fitomaticsae]UFP99730.1 helix-turn-helix domain-containing protein [Pseudomonas fitomaticsae]
MSITLIVERQDRPRGFTIIPNHILNDQRLSLKAKGLISGLLSLKSDYDRLSVEHLAKIYKTGTTLIRSGVQELKDAGYLEIEQKYDTRGYYAGYEWRLSDHPKPSVMSEISTESPYVENPHSDQPPSDHQKPTKTYKTKKLINQNTTTTPQPVSGVAVQDLRLTAPMLAETSDQVFKALEQVAPADRQRMLDELSAAIKSGTIKTTPIRWFHGVLKRYREGTFNFRPVAPQAVLEAAPSIPASKARNSPPSVKASERSGVGLEYLGKLKRATRSSNSPPPCGLTDEGPLLDYDK